MQKIIIGIAVLAVAALILAPTVHWDGASSHRVKVIVQTSDGSPVSGAEVTYRDREYDWVMKEPNAIVHMSESEMLKRQSHHYVSGFTESDGTFTFRAVFPAGGTDNLFWKTGHFRVGGTISIRAEGYLSVETPLTELVGERKMSIRKLKKKPIVVRCSLEKEISHNNQLNHISEPARSADPENG